jgi:hypothetical protein
MKFSCFSLGTFCTMPKRPPLPEGTATRAEAAAIPEVSPKRVTNMRLQSQLKPVITSHLKIGVIDRAQVEALAMPLRGDCGGAVWTRDNSGPSVDTDGAAESSVSRRGTSAG